MDHSITAEKFGVRLRPVRLEDAGFITDLRNSPHALGLIGDSAESEASQRTWLQAYFSRPGDYYFIVEIAHSRQMVGTAGVYNIEGKSGEAGRWVHLPGIPAAPASAWLYFHVCFEILDLDVARGVVVESNTSVVSFQKRIGHRCIGMAPEPRIIGGKPVNLLEYRLTRPEWPKISANLTRYALMAEKLLTRD